jgi:predicted Zn-dependent protease with MMP-like domain
MLRSLVRYTSFASLEAVMRISRKEFDRLLEAAIASLPPQFARWLDEIPVIVEHRPADNSDEDAVGLYIGASIHERPQSGELPPQILIYRIPLMDSCDSRQQLAEEIRKTLLHELGHHAGMDEDELDARGYGSVTSEDEIEFDVDED